MFHYYSSKNLLQSEESWLETIIFSSGLVSLHTCPSHENQCYSIKRGLYPQTKLWVINDPKDWGDISFNPLLLSPSQKTHSLTGVTSCIKTDRLLLSHLLLLSAIWKCGRKRSSLQPKTEVSWIFSLCIECCNYFIWYLAPTLSFRWRKKQPSVQHQTKAIHW